MHKRTFVLSLAPSGAFSFVFAPRGAAACSIQNPHQRVAASSPECSCLGGETLGNSNKTIQNPERSEWVAEAGASRFPMNGGAGFPWSIRETKSCPGRAGRNPACRGSKSTLRVVEICRRSLQTMKPRNLFGFGASFTRAAISSRGTYRPTTIDVLMFHFRVRNGTGWGHQAMTTRFQGASLSLAADLGNHLRLRVAVLCAGCRVVGSRLTSAWLWVLRFPCFALTLGYISSSRNCLSPG